MLLHKRALVLVLQSIIVLGVHCHDGCVHDTLPQRHVSARQSYVEPGLSPPDSAGQQGRRRRLATTEWGPLRLSAFYVLSGSHASAEAWIQTLIMPAAMTTLSDALNVDHVAGNLKLTRPCYSYWNNGQCSLAAESVYCGPSEVPIEHLAPLTVCSDGENASSCVEQPSGTGIAGTDHAIYMTALQTSHCGASTLACTWENFGTMA